MLAAHDHFGNTPLMQAACVGWFDAFVLLLEAGADVTLTNQSGETVRECIQYIRPKKKAAAAEKLLDENGAS